VKQIIQILIFSIALVSCQTQPDPVRFSEETLNDSFINTEGASVSLKSILEINKGRTILIDVWASWCRDCIVGLPNLRALQTEYKDVAYVFLSMDKTQESWKNGIKKYEIVGEHYFMPSGWDSAFSDFVDLDWVPRYMVIDTEGNIKLFRAIKVNDSKIKEHLK